MEPFPIAPPAFAGDSRSVPAGNAFEWLRNGWAIFTAAPGIWVVIALIMLIGGALLNFLPFIGQFASLVLTPMLAAGALQACRNSAQGRGPAIADLFWAFQNRTGPLATLGVIYAVCVMVMLGAALALVGGGAFVGALFGLGGGPAGAVGGGVVAGFVAGLIVLLACIPLFMAIWFAPALVAFNEMAPIDALRASFFATLKNIGSTTVFSVVILVAMIPASLVAGLGWLILLPVVFGALYASYRDIFPAS
jgi:uncharacterized membrane protein